MTTPTEPGSALIPPPDRDTICDNAGKALFHYCTEWKQQAGLTDWEAAYIIGVLGVRLAQDAVKRERGL